MSNVMAIAAGLVAQRCLEERRNIVAWGATERAKRMFRLH